MTIIIITDLPSRKSPMIFTRKNSSSMSDNNSMLNYNNHKKIVKIKPTFLYLVPSFCQFSYHYFLLVTPKCASFYLFFVIFNYFLKLLVFICVIYEYSSNLYNSVLLLFFENCQYFFIKKKAFTHIFLLTVVSLVYDRN